LEKIMSAWVAPSVAAEIWGISVNDVLAGIADGSIQSQVDGQFLFVDLGRHGLPTSSPRQQNSEPLVSHEEIAALTFTPIISEPEPSLSSEEEIADTLPQEELVSEQDKNDVSDWRTAREQTSQIRKAPITKAA
jgi:hypothetical protein